MTGPGDDDPGERGHEHAEHIGEQADEHRLDDEPEPATDRPPTDRPPSDERATGERAPAEEAIGQPPAGGREPDRPDTGGWDPAGIDAAFEDIVARLRADSVRSAGDEDATGPATGSHVVRPPGRPGGAGPVAGRAGRPAGPPPDDPDDVPTAPLEMPDDPERVARIEREVDFAVDGPDRGHYVPPDPGPLPRPDAITLLAWVSVVAGPLVLLAGAALGGLPAWLTASLVAAVVVGFVLLVSRLPRRDETDPDDDGARV